MTLCGLGSDNNIFEFEFMEPKNTDLVGSGFVFSSRTMLEKAMFRIDISSNLMFQI